MELKFKGQFLRDLSVDNRKVLGEVAKTIRAVQSAKTLAQIPQLKKLRKYKTHYRIKIEGNYRIGIMVRNNVVWFVRFGHRNNFYKSFP